MENIKKKPRLMQNDTPVKNLSQFDTFIRNVNNNRLKTASSVLKFKYNKKRIRVLSKATMFPEWGTAVLYWMFRDQRVQDNWALLYAQKLAIKNEVPLYVCFCSLNQFSNATIRHFDFIFKGLREIEIELMKLNIPFHFITGCGNTILPDIVQKHNIGAVVIDFCPLREYLKWVEELTNNLQDDIPIMQVDAHNIVPCWIASDKEEYAARTIRPKINSKLNEFLTDFPPLIKHPFIAKWTCDSIDWDYVSDTLEMDRTVSPVKSVIPGYIAGMKMLHSFIKNKLQHYSAFRNDPNKDASSDLSPWFHFGQISVQRCILVVQNILPHHKESIEKYMEEAIIRRELSDNFCFYNKKYDSINGASKWARDTLIKHKVDKRQYVYRLSELECSKTHDNLWNAAQKQLVSTGKMHGFLRMYWAKKILEWTPSAEVALKITIQLNDKYSLDGSDPNGFTGCMWSVCGIHDQGWAERPIFGKIRYMNYEGCKRKFDVDKFVSKYAI